MTRDPWIKFYPDDWNSDLALASCSLQTQGVYARLIAVLHRSYPYGYLPITPSKDPDNPLIGVSLSALSRVVTVHHKTLKAAIEELLRNGVLKQDEVGIYSKRMVLDQQKREAARRAGKRGGNPNLVGSTLNPTLNPGVNPTLNPTLKPEKEIEKEKEGEKTRARARENTPPTISNTTVRGWEPTDESRASVGDLISRVESLFGQYPFTPAMVGDGRAATCKEELSSVLRLLTVDEVVGVVGREYERARRESKGTNLPRNLPYYMPTIKQAFMTKDRALEAAERRRDEEKRTRTRASPDEPVAISGIIEEIVEEAEPTEENRMRIMGLIRETRERIARS